MINVIGLGYIGVPTALILAAHGNEIIGTDIDEEKVKLMQSGQVPFYEKGIVELFDQAKDNNIKFSTEYQVTDMYIITVPTPYIEETHKIDPNYVIASVKSTLEVCLNDSIIIVESTVSPGTIDKHIRPLVEKHMQKTNEIIHVVHAPERILPGNMIYELIHNSRTIGCDNQNIGERVKEIYQSFCKNEIIITDVRSAEMSKVVENTFRDINIAFANELAKICHSDGLDVYEIIRIANQHPRVNILNPGPGVGGHCIPIDPWFLVGDYPDLTNLIRTARDINDSMPSFVINRIQEVIEEEKDISAVKIGIYGLTYKANVDDTRESPTLQMLNLIDDNLEQVTIYDPEVNTKFVNNQTDDFDEFVNSVDLVVIMVGHEHIKENVDKLRNKLVLDTQNVFDSSFGFYKLS